MSLVVIENASVSFGARSIFENLSLRIAEGDRIGLIGSNGSGKSTLLRVIASAQALHGSIALDGGSVRCSKTTRIGWLPQDIAVEGGKGLLDFVTSSVQGKEAAELALAQAESEYNEIADGYARGEMDAQRLEDAAGTLADRNEELLRYDELYSPHEAARILSGLGFKDTDLERDIGEFSGGWKMRAVLSALLFQKPDVLLLDEPTNHLDMPSVAWFGNFMNTYSRSFVLISHDREFLNEQIRRVVTFETEGVRQYPGNYERYLVQRAEEEVLLENKAKNLERERKETQEFIDRFRASATKAKAVQSRVKALDRMETVETYRKKKAMRFTFPPVERSGHEVVRFENIAKRFGERTVFDNVNLTVYRGDRIGIFGPNGAGKTTLLKVVAGELEPQEGRVSFGPKVDVGYFAQHHTEKLHPKNTVLSELTAENEDLGHTRVRSILGAFLFSGDDVDKSISVLSGGERARVALAKLLAKPGNFLLLDEPTNHLDLDSCENLIESLASYEGTLLFVSHNRALIRRLANKIWAVEDQKVVEYTGTFDDYLERERSRDLEGRRADAAAKNAAKNSQPPAAKTQTLSKAPAIPAAPKEDEKARKQREARLRDLKNKTIAPLEKKVATVEAKIAESEARMAEANDKLSDAVAVLSDADRFSLLDRLQNEQNALDELNETWSDLQTQLDEAKAQFERESEPS